MGHNEKDNTLLDGALKLNEFDIDGAIREGAEEVATDTRAGFLRKAGVGGAAIIGGSAFLGALPAIAGAATIPASDIAILNFALTPRRSPRMLQATMHSQIGLRSA